MEGRGGAGRELASELAVGGHDDGQVGPDVGATQGEAEARRSRGRARRRRRVAASRPETGTHAAGAAAAVIGRADRAANGEAFTTGSSNSHRLQSPAASAGASGVQLSPSSPASGCRRPSGRTTANPTSAGAAPSVAAARASAMTRTSTVHRGRSLAGVADVLAARQRHKPVGFSRITDRAVDRRQVGPTRGAVPHYHAVGGPGPPGAGCPFTSPSPTAPATGTTGR